MNPSYSPIIDLPNPAQTPRRSIRPRPAVATLAVVFNLRPTAYSPDLAPPALTRSTFPRLSKPLSLLACRTACMQFAKDPRRSRACALSTCGYLAEDLDNYGDYAAGSFLNFSRCTVDHYYP